MKRKRKIEESPVTGELVQMMTVALFIILLAFFILLNSIAVVDDKKKMVAIGSLSESFGVLKGGTSVYLLKGEDKALTSFSIEDEIIDLTELYINDVKLFGDVHITKKNNCTVVSIPCFTLFNKNQDSLSNRGIKFLDKLIKIIGGKKYEIEITGHTDNSFLDESSLYSSNVEISSMRTLQVTKYLVLTGKIDPKHIISYGWGENRPVISNDTFQSRRLNNRVDIFFSNRSFKVKREFAGKYMVKGFYFELFKK